MTLTADIKGSILTLLFDIIRALFKFILPGRFFVWRVPNKKKQICLTFDDGPNPKFTEKLLNILNDKNIKATFFLIGQHIEKYPGLVKSINKAGHVIGLHGHTHEDIFFLSNKRIKEEWIKTQKTVKKIIGIPCELFRPPYGRLGLLGFFAAVKHGLKIIVWSLSSKDYLGYNKMIDDDIIRRVSPGKIHSGDIVLFHDDNASTLKAIPQIIDALIDQNFSLVTIPELLNNEH